MSMMIRRGVTRAVKAVPVISYVKPKAKPVEETKIETKAEPKASRKEIESMPYFSLKSMATKNGIEVADKKTAELRGELIEKLGL